MITQAPRHFIVFGGLYVAIVSFISGYTKFHTVSVRSSSPPSSGSSVNSETDVGPNSYSDVGPNPFTARSHSLVFVEHSIERGSENGAASKEPSAADDPFWPNRNFRDGHFTKDLVQDIEDKGIDIVLTWLNSSHPVWRRANYKVKQRCAYPVDASVEAVDGGNDGKLPSLCSLKKGIRSVSSDVSLCNLDGYPSYGSLLDETGFDVSEAHADIRFLLRSYAPFLRRKNKTSSDGKETSLLSRQISNSQIINKIWLIHSDLYPPPWFLKESEHLKFVKHSSILPDYAMPTFVRGVIESHLVNIPGLGEWFLQTHDDSMLLTPELVVMGNTNSGSGRSRHEVKRHRIWDWKQLLSKEETRLRWKKDPSHSPALMNKYVVFRALQTVGKKGPEKSVGPQGRWAVPLCCEVEMKGPFATAFSGGSRSLDISTRNMKASAICHPSPSTDQAEGNPSIANILFQNSFERNNLPFFTDKETHDGATFWEKVFFSQLEKVWQPPPGQKLEAVPFSSLKTNRYGVCPDKIAKNSPEPEMQNIVKHDYPCWRHGNVTGDKIDFVKRFFDHEGKAGEVRIEDTNGNEVVDEKLLNQLTHWRYVNVQGPGADDNYGGTIYNKISPIAEVVKNWMLREWPEPVMDWEIDGEVWREAMMDASGDASADLSSGRVVGVDPYTDRSTVEALEQLKYRPDWVAE